MPPTFGLALPIFAGTRNVHARTPLYDRLDVEHLKRTILEAEALGFASLWVADHFMPGRDAAILEGWTTMAWAARVTERMRIGSIHLAHLFRPPALTAKIAATLDVISGGRLDFFYEAGTPGSRREVEAYGYHFPEDNDRMAAFEEAVQVIKAMWTEDRPSFNGRHYQIKEAVCYPRPVQKPHPPVWIGALGGEQAGARAAEHPVLDVIARHADGWNNTPASVDYCRRVLGGLKRACLRNGRDYSEIKLSLETEMLVARTPGQVQRLKELINQRNPETKQFHDWEALADRYIIGDAKAVTKKIGQYVDLGIGTFQIWFMDYPSLDGMRTFAEEVMPHFGARRPELAERPRPAAAKRPERRSERASPSGQGRRKAGR